MIKVKDKLSGKVVRVPEVAEEFTLGDYCNLLSYYRSNENPTALGVVSALSGVPEATLADYTGPNADVLETLPYQLLESIKEIEQWQKAKPPAKLEVSGQLYPLPNWKLETLGQRLAYSQLLGEGADERLPEFLAVYFGRAIYGDDWSDSKEMLADEMRNCKARDAVPTAFFFWTKQAYLKRNGRLAWFGLLTRILKRRAGNVWRNLAYWG